MSNANELQRASLTALDRQLAAARYTFHKVNLKRYADAVNLGLVTIDPDGNEVVVKMPHDQAKEMYRMAMENYDGIIKNAVSGASVAAGRPVNELDNKWNWLRYETRYNAANDVQEGRIVFMHSGGFSSVGPWTETPDKAALLRMIANRVDEGLKI